MFLVRSPYSNEVEGSQSRESLRLFLAFLQDI